MDKTQEQVLELQIGQKEQFDTSNYGADIRGQQNLAMPSLLGTVVLDNKLSAAEDRNKADACTELEAAPFDHCDSMSRSSLAHDEFVVSSPRNKDSTNKTDSTPAEPSGSSTASDQVNHSMSKVSSTSRITITMLSYVLCLLIFCHSL